MTRRDPYRYYRRQMRRSRRGGYPVIIPGIPYEPLGWIAVAALSRWAYRHRSAFLPFAITGTLYVAATELHLHHRGWWAVIVFITFTAGFVAGIPHTLTFTNRPGRHKPGLAARMWEACGINRPAERAYVTILIGACGGWLAAATGLGPAHKPLPLISAIGTIILGIPWWAHRRRRAKVRIERTVQAWPELAENMGLPGSRIASATGDAWGFTARIILRKGTTAIQAVNQVPAIESGLGIRPGSVRALPDPSRADRLILRVIENDPHAQPIPWPGQPATSIANPVELGLFEDGRPVAVSILRRNALVGGMTDSGKSGILNVILAFLAACADVIIWGIDLKGGMELQPWANCLDEIATTPGEAIALLRDATTELDRRAASLTGQGQRLLQPSATEPALITVIDEYAEMPADALAYADSVARRGRAIAVNLIAATQRPTQEAMGNNAVRSQMDVRICLRVRERRDVDLILGQGAFRAGWHAQALTEPGSFLISAREHTTPDRARGYLITDRQVAGHAARHAVARPGPGAGPGHPAGAPGSAQPPAPGPAGVPGRETAPGSAEAAQGALWAALCDAPEQGYPVWVLMGACGKSRSWVYARLTELAAAGRAEQARYGSWRAAGPPGGHAG